MQNFLLKHVLQIFIHIFSDKKYIFCFDLKKTLLEIKIAVFESKYSRHKKKP